MTKLAYINDQQFVSDAAQALIKSHLSWSSSDRDMPSKDLSNVCSMMIDTYLEANYTIEQWQAFTEEQRANAVSVIRDCMFAEAKKIADAKWAAAMTLLGIA